MNKNIDIAQYRSRFNNVYRIKCYAIFVTLLIIIFYLMILDIDMNISWLLPRPDTVLRIPRDS